MMQHTELEYKVCDSVCVCMKERGGGSGIDAGSVMPLLWQIDVKSSRASLPLHRVNNDERRANEGLREDVCVHMCVSNG